MKKLVSILGILAVAGLLMAQTANAADKKTHEVTATVVATDLTAKTITIKDEKGGDKVIPVLDGGLDSLKTVKAGDTVVLTCQDNEKGEHTGITAIKPAKK